MRQLIIYTFLLITVLSSCSNPLIEVFENYKINVHRINTLCDYFNEVRPHNIDIWIRFNEENTFDVRMRTDDETNTTNEIFDQYGSFHKYSTTVNDSLTQKALSFISFNPQKIDSLKILLDGINCNSIGYKYKIRGIKNIGGGINIGFPTNDLYGLNYIIMDTLKSNEFLNDVEKSKCNFKVINEKVLLEYLGPAWGSDCFPDKK